MTIFCIIMQYKVTKICIFMQFIDEKCAISCSFEKFLVSLQRKYIYNER